MKIYKSIFASKCFKLVRSSLELISGFLGKILCNFLCESNVSVKACTYCSATLSDFKYTRKCSFNSFKTMFELSDITSKLLT